MLLASFEELPPRSGSSHVCRRFDILVVNVFSGKVAHRAQADAMVSHAAMELCQTSLARASSLRCCVIRLRWLGSSGGRRDAASGHGRHARRERLLRLLRLHPGMASEAGRERSSARAKLRVQSSLGMSQHLPPYLCRGMGRSGRAVVSGADSVNSVRPFVMCSAFSRQRQSREQLQHICTTLAGGPKYQAFCDTCAESGVAPPRRRVMLGSTGCCIAPAVLVFASTTVALHAHAHVQWCIRVIAGDAGAAIPDVRLLPPGRQTALRLALHGIGDEHCCCSRRACGAG